MSSPAELSDAHFRKIAAVAHEAAGLVLLREKAPMIRSRLARRLRALGLEDYGAYCSLLSGPGGESERAKLVSALTTNVSRFFREPHHFDMLRREVFENPAFAADRHLRVWSAGCAQGQEAYSIAITGVESGLERRGRTVQILASDIDDDILARAQAGVFEASQSEGIDAARRARFFEASGGDGLAARPGLRRHVRFERLNLNGPWPARPPFHAIFCRNVVIYFDAAAQARLWRRFADALVPGGWLFLGHSERIAASADCPLASRGVTAYQHAPAPGQGGR